MKPARLTIEPEAEAELEEASERYESNVPGLGLDFLVEMRKRTQGNTLHVLAFMHPRQRPGYWAHRVP